MQVLITGATGLIGYEVAALLLQQGHKLTCLVRSNGNLPDGAAAIRGDVGDARMGLSDRDHAALAARTELIIHCAAVTGFAAPAAEHERVNVGGTANVIALAKRAHCPLIHVSTAYVCGDSDGEILEARAAAGAGFANGYEASKAAGERLIEAGRRDGVPIAIARPSIVTGHSISGAIRRSCDIYRFLELIAAGEISTLPVSPEARLDLVPIDHVARSICALADRIAEAAGRNFHIVSGNPVPVAGLARAIAAMSEASPRLVDPAAFRPELLPRREQRWHRHVTRPYAHYLQRCPRFRDDNLRELTGLASPDTGADYLKLLLDALRDEFSPALREAA